MCIRDRATGARVATRRYRRAQRRERLPVDRPLTVIRARRHTAAHKVGPSPRNRSTSDRASRSPVSHSSVCCPTRCTHHASASERDLATPASTSVSSTWRSLWRSRVIAGTARCVNSWPVLPIRAPQAMLRPYLVWASSAILIRCSRVSSRQRVIRPSAAAGSSLSGAGSSPITVISSRSTVTTRSPVNQSSGMRPANQAAASLASGRSPCCQPPCCQPPGRPKGPPRRGPPVPRRPGAPEGVWCSCFMTASVLSTVITALHQYKPTSSRLYSGRVTTANMNDRRDGDSSTIPSGSPDALPCRNERVHHAEIRLTKDAMDATDRQVAPRRRAKGKDQPHDDHGRTSDPERRFHQPRPSCRLGGGGRSADHARPDLVGHRLSRGVDDADRQARVHRHLHPP